MDSFTTIFLLVLILSLGFLIRLPYLDFPIDEDYGFYTYVAHFRSRGVKFIKDFWGVLFPILFYLKIGVNNLCKGDVKKIRLFFAAYNTLTTVSIYYLAAYLNGSVTGLLAALLYSVFSSAPHLGSYSINAEKYYLLPITLSACFFLVGIDSQANFMMVLSGIFLGIAFLIKPVVIVSIGAFALYIVIYGGWTKLAPYFIAISSTLLIHFLVVGFTFRKDLGVLFIQNKLRFISCLNNMGSILDILERIVVDIKPILKETLFLWVAIIPYLYAAVYERSPNHILIILWVIAVFITLAGQRVFWQYQYQPVIHIFSIASAISLVNYFEQFDKNNLISGLLFGILLFLSLIYSLLNLSYYFICRKDRRKFFNTFRKMDQYLHVPELAKYIKNNSTDIDRIYVWGPWSHLYTLSDRLSCEKSIFHFLRPFKKEHEYQYDELSKGIIEKKPKYIIQVFSNFNIDYLNKLTGFKYVVERVFYNRYMVYRVTGVNDGCEKLYKENDSWKTKKEKLEKLSTGVREHIIFRYYLELGMDNNYVKEFEESLKINPYDVSSLVHLAIYYREKQEFEKSLRYLKKALSIKKYRYWIHFEMAMTYQDMGKKDMMKKELEKAKRWLFPYNAGLWKLLGTIYRLSGNAEKSIKWLKMLLKINYPIEWLYFELALSCKESGRQEEAIECFNKELKLYSSKPYVHYHLASVLESKGRLDEAMEHFKAVINHGNPPLKFQAGGYYHLGAIFMLKNKIKEAVSQFEKCIDLMPNHKKAAEQLKLVETMV